MSYQIEFHEKVYKELKSVGKLNAKIILSLIKDFAENFSTEYECALIKTGKIKKLNSLNNELYRLRLRSYRVIYFKDNEYLKILIVRVGHRKNVYKNLQAISK